MKLAYADDVHGTTEIYEGIIEAAAANEADVLVFGGDMLLHTRRRSSISENAEMQKRNLDDIIALFSEANSAYGMETIFIFGNGDMRINEGYAHAAAARAKGVHYLKNNYLVMKDIAFVGYPYVKSILYSVRDWEKTDTPDSPSPEPKDEFMAGWYSVKPEEGTIYDDVTSLLSRAPPNKKLVLIAHSPPYGTNLDLSKIDDGEVPVHIGSKGVRMAIEEYHPFAAFHGHIHESNQLSGSYFDLIGSTIAFNPGWASPHRVNLIFFDTEKGMHSLFGCIDEYGVTHST